MLPPPMSVRRGRSGVDSGELRFRESGMGFLVGVEEAVGVERYSMTVAVDLRRMEEQALCGPAWARAEMVPVAGEICNF